MAEVLSRALGDSIIGSPQRDYNHADDNQYKSLRAEAEREYNSYRRLSEQASKAYKEGDKSEASDLSEQAKAHQRKGEDLNIQAAQWVFRANNADSGPDEIDLHGLFVKESLSALDARVNAARNQHEQILKVITGKGLHSENHQSKLKPAVEDYCRKNNLKYRYQRGNDGVIEILFNETGQGHQQGGQQHGQQHGGHQHGGQQHGGQHHQQSSSNTLSQWIKIFKHLKRAFTACFR